MSTGLKDLLISPDRFFSEITQEKANLIPPVIIVAGGCAISLLGTIIPLSISFVYSSVIGSSTSWMHFTAVAFAWYLLWRDVLPPFLGWILIAVILYLVSRFFSQEGSFHAVLQNTGYGLLPWAISRLVTIIVTSVLIARPEYYQTDLLLNPATVSALLFYGFLLWCCALWVFAMKHTCRIPARRAAIVVLFSVILCFVPVYLAAYFPLSF